jgi:hypothetical protein
MNDAHRRTLDDVVRDLDLLVYRLEQAPSDDVERLQAERRRLRRELEAFRDRLGTLADDLW